MKAFLACFFFLFLTEIALSEDVQLTASVVPAPAAAMTVPAADAPLTIDSAKSALADCIQQTVHDVTPQAMLVIYPAILFLLRLLSEALGKLAAAGSGSASTAVVGIRYLVALLGWFFGKSGWGTPTKEIVQKLPKMKAMKIDAMTKAATKA